MLLQKIVEFGYFTEKSAIKQKAFLIAMKGFEKACDLLPVRIIEDSIF